MNNKTELQIIESLTRLLQDPEQARWGRKTLEDLFSLALTACNIPRQELYSEKDNNTLVLSILRTIDPAGNWFMWPDRGNLICALKEVNEIKKLDECIDKIFKEHLIPLGLPNQDKAKAPEDNARSFELREAKIQGMEEAYKDISSWLRTVGPGWPPKPTQEFLLNPNDAEISLSKSILRMAFNNDPIMRADHENSLIPIIIENSEFFGCGGSAERKAASDIINSILKE